MPLSVPHYSYLSFYESNIVPLPSTSSQPLSTFLFNNSAPLPSPTLSLFSLFLEITSIAIRQLDIYVEPRVTLLLIFDISMPCSTLKFNPPHSYDSQADSALSYARISSNESALFTLDLYFSERVV